MIDEVSDFYWRIPISFHRYILLCSVCPGNFEHDEADSLVDRLLSNGYLYEHNGIRLTGAE
jgi:hypothetical protein